MPQKRSATLPEKANKILNGILVALILIAVKVWHLTVIQHEKKEEEATKPQRRVVIERSERAAIYDRFNIPLATNKIQYHAAISYGAIRDLPRSAWKRNSEGKRVKHFPRKEYIAQLSNKLAEELTLDPTWIEDLIHSKAALLGNVPCVIKQNISERQYFHLKMLEKDWPGLQAEIAAKRVYPLGAIGGEVVGYIGPISRREYDAITQEMGGLREALSAYEEGEKEPLPKGYTSIEEVAARLEELEKKAYRINDFVGKSGVEAFYDEVLRGLCGKQIYLSDTRGNFLRKLPGSEEIVLGNSLHLSLSAELQTFAQQLLAEYENEPASALPVAKRPLIPPYQPWIKGGAIVVMDPNDGQIYALASSPTFDPNDFIRSGNEGETAEKNMRVNQWLETEEHLAQIWNMKIPYCRQRFDEDYYEEEMELSWENYLNLVLPKQSEVREVLAKRGTLRDAIWVQKKIEQLLFLFKDPAPTTLTDSKILDLLYRDSCDIPLGITITLPEKEFFDRRYREVKEEVAFFKNQLGPYFSQLSSNYDKQLLTDLYRLAVDPSYFSPALIEGMGGLSLSDYHEASARCVSVTEALRSLVKDVFFEEDFKEWREKHFKEYLAERRREEKEGNKKYARPYIEYLEKMQKELFQIFWEKNRWELISLFLSGKIENQDPTLHPYRAVIKNWSQELHKGAHRGLEWVYPYHRLCQLAGALDQTELPGFLKTLRPFDQLNRPLIGRYPGLRGGKERDLAAAFYPGYGFGFARSHAFRQAATIGSLFKLVPAYEALRQRYLAFKEKGESHSDLNPLTIIDDKHHNSGKNEVWNVGFTLDGRTIPMFYRGGRLPRSEHFKVGKVDLIRALEVSSNPYFAMLSGDILEDPEDLCQAANLLGFGEKTGIDLPGEYAGRIPVDIAYNRTGLYAMSIGQHSLVGTPLQTAVMLALIVNGGKVLKPQIIKEPITQGQLRWQVFMPPQIQNILLTGLRQVVMGEKGTARFIRQQFDPALVKHIIGKTSTSEVIERMSLDGTNGQMKLKHVWFGGIAYETNDFSKPELIVVVYLRYGGWGKDAAPLAVEIVKKWHEIKRCKHWH
jgi:cell division protein FtsI/penicillin-binding protein 2